MEHAVEANAQMKKEQLSLVERMDFVGYMRLLVDMAKCGGDVGT